jgi:hypothetical protein
MSLFISILRHDNLILKATADVAAGWRQNERSNGFFGRGSLDYPGNRRVEITLNVRVRPFGNPQHFPKFPEDILLSGDLERDGDAGLGVYAVKNGKAGLLIAVGALAAELEKSEDQPVHFDNVILRRGSGPVHIRMVASVVVRSAPPEPIGDIPEWDTQFFQGGLPSLGKRRP